jgi:hypothetical protein
VRVLSQSSLVDALSQWGAHEAAGRLIGQQQIDPSDRLASLNLVLHVRSPFVARILFRQPQATLSVDFDIGDLNSLILADGRSIESWITTVRASGGDSLSHFDKLVSGSGAPVGPIFAAGTGSPDSQSVESLVLYDGWHRAAAWFERARLGKADSPLNGYVVLSGLDDPLLQREVIDGAV